MKKCRLGDIAVISAGQGAPQDSSDYCDYGVPFIKAANLKSLSEGGSLSEIQRVTPEAAKKHKLKLHPSGTIVFAKSGMSCLKGIVYALPSPSYVVNHLATVTPNRKGISPYLQFYFQYHKPNRLIKDDAYPSISLSDIANIEIRLPEEAMQARRVNVLNHVVGLIYACKAALGKLDELVKARFVEMFGDWRRNPKALPQVLGRELFVFSSGKFLPATKRKECGIPVYGGHGVTWYTNTALVHKPTIIIGRVGAQCGNINLAIEPVWITDNAIYIKCCKREMNNLFLKELMTQMDFHQYADYSGQPKITQRPLEEARYIVPNMELQNAFAAFVGQIDKSKVAVQKALDKAQQLYDSLMQEYFD